uniref:Uncharacterized protein n=1 Tax=Arundo donax TaxID=35708 RepID=A0A0A8Y574_ARUDO
MQIYKAVMGSTTAELSEIKAHRPCTLLISSVVASTTVHGYVSDACTHARNAWSRAHRACRK